MISFIKRELSKSLSLTLMGHRPPINRSFAIAVVGDAHPTIAFITSIYGAAYYDYREMP